MGDNISRATLYAVLNGGSAEPFPVEFGEFTLPDGCADSAEPRPVQSLDDLTLEVKSKHLRCKSRRRLVKLLMEQGRSRNDSNRIARQCRECGIPYKREWFRRFFTG